MALIFSSARVEVATAEIFSSQPSSYAAVQTCCEEQQLCIAVHSLPSHSSYKPSSAGVAGLRGPPLHKIAGL